MTVDYYSLMTKAVAGRDPAARDQIYKDAYSLIEGARLPREVNQLLHATRYCTGSRIRAYCMDQPWLTTSDCPVSAFDSKPAKNKATSATSWTVDGPRDESRMVKV